MAGGVVEVVFLGNSRDYEATLARMGVATDAAGTDIANKFGASGTSAAEKFTSGIDSGTSKIGSIFTKIGNEASQFGLPFSSNLQKIGTDLNNVTTKSKGMLEAMSTVGAVGVAAIAGVAVEAVHLADGFDKSQAALETAVKNSGHSWSQYSAQVSAAAKTTGALVTGNADEVDQSLQELTSATQSPKKALSDLSIAEGIAALKHISLASATQGLVKILGGSTRILQQWGINIDIGSGKLHSIQAAQEAVTKSTDALNAAQAEVSAGTLVGVNASAKLQSAQLSLRDAQLNLKQSENAIPAVLDTLKQRTEGAAAALGATLPGEITIAKNSIHNLGIEFGEFLLPAIDKVLGAGAKIGAFFEQNKSAAVALGVVIGGPLVAAMTVFSGRAALSAISSLGKLAIGFTTLAGSALSKLPLVGAAFQTEAAQQDAAVATQLTGLDILGTETATTLARNAEEWQAFALAAQAESARVLAATGAIDVGLADMVTEARAQAAQFTTALSSVGIGAQQAAGLVSAADGEMVVSTTVASRGIMAALGSTGVGLIVIGLGVAVTELMQHWNQVWPVMQASAVSFANFVIANVINPLISSFDRLVNVITLGIVKLHGELSSVSSASSAAGVAPSYSVNSGSASVPLPKGTTSAQSQVAQQLVAAGATVANAIKEAVTDKLPLKYAELALGIKSTAASATNSATAITAQVAKMLGTNGSGTAGGGTATTPTGGAGPTTITPADAAMEVTAKALQGVLSRAIAGGTTFSQQGKTVGRLVGATGGKNAAEEASLVSSLNATNNPTLTGLAQSIETTWQNATTKLTTIIDSDTTKGQSELQKLQSAQQSTSIRSILDATDSAAKAGYNQLVSELKSTHEKALDGLVKNLEANWKATMAAMSAINAALATEQLANTVASNATIAGIQTQAAQQAGTAATQVGAGTTSYTGANLPTLNGGGSISDIAAAVAAALPGVSSSQVSGAGGSLGSQAAADQLTAAATSITDAMNISNAGVTAQTTAIKDAATLMSDAAALQVQAISAQTTAMQDTSNAQVSAIQDQTQTQVDTLGERGLYGLQLIAQQAKVAVDAQKAIDDANIAAAQAHLDQVTAATNQQVLLAQQKSDQDQAINDASVAASQMAVLITQQANDVNVAKAQATSDTVQITSAIMNANAEAAASAASLQAQALSEQAAQLSTASQFAVGATQRSDEAQSQLLTSQASAINAGASKTVQAVENQTSLANQNAASALQQAQSVATNSNAAAAAQLAAIQNAANTQAANDAANLATVQANASVTQALASQQLSAIQSQANVTEAKLTSIYNVDQEMANVEFAGSGVQIYVMSQAPSDEAAINAAASYAFRYKAS